MSVRRAFCSLFRLRRCPAIMGMLIARPTEPVVASDSPCFHSFSTESFCMTQEISYGKLIGASLGPGDPELITRRAWDVL